MSDLVRWPPGRLPVPVIRRGQVFLPAPDPIGKAGCVMWTAADRPNVPVDAAAVDLWADLTGQGRHWTQSTGADQPTFQTAEILGQPVVRLDGTSDYLAMQSFPTLSAGFTLSIALKVTSLPGERLLWGQSAFDATARLKIGINPGGTCYIDVIGPTNADRIIRTSSTAIPIGVPVVLTFTWDGTTSATGIKLYMNAVDVSGTTSTQGTFTGLAAGGQSPSLGAQAFFPDFLAADVGEQVLYNSLASAPERDALLRYLARWVPISTLTDPFDDGVIDAAKWTALNNPANVTEAGGLFHLNPPTANDYAAARSTSYYNAAGDAAFGKFVLYAGGSHPSRQGGMTLYRDAANYLDYGIFGDNLGYIFNDTGPGGGGSDFETYSPTTHAWLRLRVDATTVYFDTSTDGTTWANWRTHALPTWPMNGVQARFFAGWFGAGDPDPGEITVDNFNLTPTGATAPAEAAASSWTAQDAQAAIGPSAEAAPAAAAAQDAQASVRVSAEAAVASAQAQDAQAAIRPSAEAAASSWTAGDLQAGVAPSAEAALLVAQALDATAVTGTMVNAEAATTSWTATDAQAGLRPSAEAAASSWSSTDGQASIGVSAEAALSPWAAQDATASTANATQAPAEAALSSWTAGDLQAAIAPHADPAATTWTAPDAQASIAAPAEAALTGWPAQDATTQIRASAEAALSPWTAPDAQALTGTLAFAQAALVDLTAPDVQASIRVSAEQLAVAASALDATVALAKEATAEAATATAAAQDATTRIAASTEPLIVVAQALDAVATVGGTTTVNAEAALVTAMAQQAQAGIAVAADLIVVAVTAGDAQVAIRASAEVAISSWLAQQAAILATALRIRLTGREPRMAHTGREPFPAVSGREPRMTYTGRELGER